MRSLVIFIGLLLATAAHAAPFPSPADWRDENIYFIFLDRFYDGDPSNNNVESAHGASYSPSDAHAIHGGDLKGVQQKLDYIKSLGATAIWVTPIVYNVGNSAFHGYGAQDFYQLAPHWGTMTDLSNMVSAAHARGIKVILDIVCNHSGDLIDSGDAGYPNFLAPPAGYNMRYTNPSQQHAPPFNITNATPSTFTSIFHNNGAIQNFGITQQVVLGELDGLDDFATETAYVRTNMAKIYEYWVGAGDFDGFRIDTVKHVDYGFWQYWCPQLHQYATSIGKSNFFMFGEVFDSSEALVGSYTGTMGGGPFKLDSSLDYPLYDTVNSVFATASGNTKQIEDHYNAIAANYDTNAWYRLVTFLDNHDNPRFLSSSEANDNTNRLAVALEFLYTSRGIPCLYYGTEQAFDGTTDPNNREDMFAGQFEQGPSLGDNFNETHPLYQLVAKLNNFRRLYQSVRRGVHNNRWNTPGGPGLFAYSRVFSNEEVFVVFNTASSTQTLSNRSTIYPSGTVLVNLLDTNETIVVTAITNTTPQISVPSMTAKIFIAQSLMQPLDPVIISQSPGHAATCISASAPIVLQFSKPMDINSVQAAFSVTPATPGTFTWNTLHDTMTFTPSTVWPTFTTNLIHLATNAVDSVSGNLLYAPFDTYFVTFTTSTVTTTSSPAGGGTTSGGGTVNCGSNITICATPNPCYSFVYWTRSGSLASTSACYSFFATSNEAVVVNFVNGQGALATDNSADPLYTTNGWSSGSNGGFGFGPWVLMETSTDGSRNGFFIGSSTSDSPHLTPGIDVSGGSWGIYANNNNTAAVYRAFATGPIHVGGQLLIDMDNGFNDVAGSAVGFSLRNGDATNSPTDYATGARLQFYLAGNSTDYTIVDAGGAFDSGVPLTYAGVRLIFTLGTNDNYTLAIITNGSGSTNTISGTLGGTPSSTLDSIALFNNNAGAGASHNVFFNSLSVANFTPITYTIDTSSSPSGGGSTSGGGMETCGMNVTVVATANIGYNFVNWTEGGVVASTLASYGFTANVNRTLVANFTPTVCNFTLSSTGTNVSATGGSGSVGVSAGSGCSWTATSNIGWITIDAGSSGTGNGSVNYSVASSASNCNSSTGTITIAGQLFTVTQAGDPGSYTITPTNTVYAAGGGTGSVSVTAGSGCSWTATSNIGWITIDAGSSGTGNGTVNYSVAFNAGSCISNTGTITIAGQLFTVTQDGGSGGYSISSTNATYAGGGGSGSVNVTAGGGCSWTATNNVGWLTITSGNGGTGNGTVNYAVDANPLATLRSGTLTIAGQTFTVTQAGNTTAPTVILTAPAAGIASNTIVVSATATDNVGVVKVEFYRDANVLLGTVTTPPYRMNFDTTTVADGSHCFYAKAYNPASNVGNSATNCVIVDRNPPSVPIGLTARTVATNQINLSWSASSDSGSGVASYRVFRDGEQIGTTADTQYSDIGLAAKTVYCYAVAAQDELGHVSGPSADACAQTFITPVSALGRYNGLAIQTNAPTHASSGSIKLMVSKNGPFAASLSLGGVQSAFKGQFDDSGNTTTTVTRTGLNSLQVILHLDMVNHTDQISGTVSDGGFTSEVLADRQVFSAKARCPLAGTFTLVLEPPEGTDPSIPEGFGYGTLMVTPTGLGRVSGVLADGTKINVSVPLSKHGTWPLYQVLYQNQGACIGWVTFGTNSSVGATVDWFRPPQSTSHYFPAGFTTNVTLQGEKYVPPTNGGPSVAGTNVVMLGGGNLVSSIVETVLVSDVGSVAVFSPNAENLQMKIQTTTGQFSGSFTHPVLGKTVTFNGLVLQLDGTGAGYFLGSSASGFVVFEPTS